MTPPFTDTGPGEVLSRVARAYVKMRYRQGRYAGRSPSQTVYAIARDTPGRMVPLHVALGALGDYLARRKGTTADWVHQATMASRYGLVFRRCLWPDYKRGR